jgi:hypothetical protein
MFYIIIILILLILLNIYAAFIGIKLYILIFKGIKNKIKGSKKKHENNGRKTNS